MKNIIYFDKLKPFDIWTTGIYMLATISLFFISVDNGILFFYAFFLHLGIYVFLYKSLRNFKVYTIWLVIGGVHFLLFYFLEDLDSNSKEVVNIILLKNTVPLLIIYQILRLFSLLIQNREFVAPRPYSFKDMQDKRTVSFFDYFLFFIYVFFLVAFSLR